MTRNKTEFGTLSMFGVDPSCLGGISTLTRMLSFELDRCEQVDFCYLITTNQGNALQKIRCFVSALLKARKRFSTGEGIVHIHMADNASVIRSCVIIFLAKRYRQSVVLHIHCDLAKIRSRSSNHMKKLIDWSLLKSDRIIALGTYLNPLFQKLDYPSERVLILPNAVSCPDENLYTPGRTRVLFLGNISKDKGVLDLLDALVLIDDKLDPELIFELCGRDHIKVQVEIEKRNLSHRVKYRGIVEPNRKFFSKYLLNVLPSHHEAMPFSLLEASAYGIPSIASSVGSISEIIDNGDSGWLVNAQDTQMLANTLVNVLSNSEAISVAGSRIYNKVRECYSFQAYLQTLFTLYRELIA